MKESFFLLSIAAVTVYLTVAAWEDYKSCKVTRWKHLIGGIPVLLLPYGRYEHMSWQKFICILVFVVLFVIAGYVGVYGNADGYVLAILTLYFGNIGGVAGVGIVILIMILASFSFLISHIIKSILDGKKIFRNMADAYIPHIFTGYLIACIGLFIYAT